MSLDIQPTPPKPSIQNDIKNEERKQETQEIQTARHLLSEGKDIAYIMSVTGLPENKILTLQNTLPFQKSE